MRVRSLSGLHCNVLADGDLLLIIRWSSLFFLFLLFCGFPLSFVLGCLCGNPSTQLDEGRTLPFCLLKTSPLPERLVNKHLVMGYDSTFNFVSQLHFN